MVNNFLKFPTELAFEPIQLCNAACFCCPYSWLQDDSDYRGKTMPKEHIEQLLRDFCSPRKKYGFDGALVVSPFRFSDPLLCKDLEFILQLAEELDFFVQITTNGMALTKRVCHILEKYSKYIIKLNVSLIGHDAKSVNQLMGLNFDKVLKNMTNNIEPNSSLSKISSLTIRKTELSKEEADGLSIIEDKIKKIGLRVKFIEEGWITNRINSDEYNIDGSKPETITKPQNEHNFVLGCGWVNHLVTRIEVNLDGDVVLCCDDAEKNKVLGNVFETSIEDVWVNNVLPEHSKIFEQHYSKDKNNLICAECTRAVWKNSTTKANCSPPQDEYLNLAKNQLEKSRAKRKKINRSKHKMTSEKNVARL